MKEDTLILLALVASATALVLCGYGEYATLPTFGAFLMILERI